MKFICMIVLIVLGYMESISDCLKLVGPDAPLLAEAGKDLVLPCSLQPNTSAVDMRVEWFRVDVVDSLVHLYKDQKDRNEKQIASYRGRTAMFREELQKGNTSLRLSAVRRSDEGDYKCLVEAKNEYDDITVNVIVEALGTHPMITVEGYDTAGGMKLVCESRGWNPEPGVLWLDHEGNTLITEDTETHRDTEGFTVKRRITVYDSNRFYCRILQKHHMMETHISISGEVLYVWRSAVISISVLVPVIVAGLIVALVIYYKKELKKEKQYTEFLKRKVDVTLDPDTAHPGLILSDDGKQVTCGDTEQNLPENTKRFDKCVMVLGKEGFSSGRFYYEVQVRGKTKWDLGVVRESINRKGKIIATPQNGFWIVILRNGDEYQACADTSVLLTLREKPQKVGVFVDYEEGLVSFYDVENRSHIYSFTGQSFTEKLYPFFSPCNNDGGKNSAPLIISPDS